MSVPSSWAIRNKRWRRRRVIYRIGDKRASQSGPPTSLSSSLARSLISYSIYYPPSSSPFIPDRPGRWNWHWVPKRRLLYFRRRGNSQKNIDNMPFIHITYRDSSSEFHCCANLLGDWGSSVITWTVLQGLGEENWCYVSGRGVDSNMVHYNTHPELKHLLP